MVVKFERSIIKGKAPISNFLTDCDMMKQYANKIPVMPKYKINGTIGGKKFFIMEFLDISLDDAFKKDPGKLSNLAL